MSREGPAGGLARAYDRARASLWVVPATLGIAGAALAELVTRLDFQTSAFRGDAEAVRALLGTIATAGLTVLGVTLTITLAVLALTAQTYSPRAVRRFLRDRLLQSVVGAFVATVTFALVALRQIEDGGDYATTAALGVVLVLVAIALLIALFHHLAREIRIEAIMAAIRGESLAVVDREWPDEGVGEQIAPEPEGPVELVTALDPGAVAAIDDRKLERLGCSVWVLASPGTWVGPGDSIAAVSSGASERAVERLRSSITISSHRGIRQDPAYGVRQLVDIALRAMSPSLSDPTTAIGAVRHASAIVERAAGRRLGPFVSWRGESVLVRPRPTFAHLVAVLLDEPRRLAGAQGEVAVLAALRESLERIACATTDPHRLDVVERHRIELAAATAASGLAGRDAALADGHDPLDRPPPGLPDGPAGVEHLHGHR